MIIRSVWIVSGKIFAGGLLIVDANGMVVLLSISRSLEVTYKKLNRSTFPIWRSLVKALNAIWARTPAEFQIPRQLLHQFLWQGL